MEATKKLLAQVGLQGERVEMFNLSSAMGLQFAEYVQEMARRVQAFGPSPLRAISAPRR